MPSATKMGRSALVCEDANVAVGKLSGALAYNLGERCRRADNVGVGDDVDQGDGVAGQCGLHRGCQSVRVAHSVAFGAEAPGVTGEVHLSYLDAGRAAERLLL